MDLTPGPGEDQERSEEPADLAELVRELDGLLWRIEGNYNREGSGPGSRFDGETLEAVQARALVRHVWPLAYRAGREDEARENVAAIRFANDLATTSGVSLSAAVEAIRACTERDKAMRRAGREDAARDVQRFGESQVCYECGPQVEGFADAARGDQPRTLKGAETTDTESSPEVERADG